MKCFSFRYSFRLLLPGSRTCPIPRTSDAGWSVPITNKLGVLWFLLFLGTSCSNRWTLVFSGFLLRLCSARDQFCDLSDHGLREYLMSFPYTVLTIWSTKWYCRSSCTIPCHALFCFVYYAPYRFVRKIWYVYMAVPISFSVYSSCSTLVS